MKKIAYIFISAAIVAATALGFVSCGDDDGVEPMPKESNVLFVVDNLSDDLHMFYNIEVTYKDLKGTTHSETIDGRDWSYKENKGPENAELYCQVVANAKQNPEIVEKESYNITYHYSVNYYKYSTKAGSENPAITERSITKSELDNFLKENKQLVIMSFRK